MQGMIYTPGSDAEKSIDAATAISNGTVKAMNTCRQVGWDIISAGTITDGTVKIESASTADYSGTWFELDTLEVVDLDGGDAYHGTYPGPLAFVRGRIHDTVTGGGTITVRINGLLG